MKTFWKETAVVSSAAKDKLTPTEWIVRKKVELEQSSGVSWSVSQEEDGFNFRPTSSGIRSVTPLPVRLKQILDAYREHEGDEFVTFLTIHEETGLDLRTIIEAVLYLEEEGQASRETDREGNEISFRINGEVLTPDVLRVLDGESVRRVYEQLASPKPVSNYTDKNALWGDVISDVKRSDGYYVWLRGVSLKNGTITWHGAKKNDSSVRLRMTKFSKGRSATFEIEVLNDGKVSQTKRKTLSSAKTSDLVHFMAELTK